MGKTTHHPGLHILTPEAEVKPPIEGIGNTSRRILIVKDYLKSFNSDEIRSLADALADMGYTVIVYNHADNLDDSISGLETFCEDQAVDLIVSFDTGCLFIAPLYQAPRLFINPDWSELESEMNRLSNRLQGGEDLWAEEEGLRRFKVNSQELDKARQFRMNDNITPGKHPALCWFTDKNLDGNEANIVEQLKKFRNVEYRPHLTTDTLNTSLYAKQIDGLMKRL